MDGRYVGRVIGLEYAGRNHRHAGRAGLFSAISSAGAKTSFDLPLADMSSGVFTIAPRSSSGSATPTYTGATAKTTIDFEGLLKTCLSGEVRCLGGRRVRNVVVGSSEDFTNVNWVNSGLTVTPGVSDPWGGTTAQTLTSTANNKEIYQNIPTVAGNKHAAATWIRRRTGTGTIRMYCNNALVVLPLTSTWQRLGASATAVGALVYVGINIAVSGDAVDIVRIQHENTTGQSNQNPSEYVSVGVLSAPVYHGVGVDGVKVFTTLNGNTVASNVVSEATGAPITSAEAACAGGVTAGVVDAVGPVGYLPEGARTQRALHSQAFSNAVWVSGGGGIAVTDNSFVAPDGTTTADTMTASGANGTLIQDLGTVGSAAKAGGLWLYRKTGTGNIDLTLDGGSTWTTKAITAAWTRVQISQTLADEDFGIRIVTSGDEVYAWQGQVETASFLSSDIASTTVAVTRNADVLTYVSAGNISGTVGSAYAEYFPPASRIASTQVIIQASTIGSRHVIYQAGNGLMGIYDGTTQTQSVLPTTVSVLNKIATSWGSGKKVSLNGATAVSGAFDGDMNVTTNFAVGCDSATLQLFGPIRNILIYPREKSAAQLESTTA